MDLGIVNYARGRAIHRPEVPNFRTVCRLARAWRLTRFPLPPYILHTTEIWCVATSHVVFPEEVPHG